MFNFEIEKTIGIIAEYPTGWRKEINLISWMGMPAKYDIRDWSPDREHMSKGITLTEEELDSLINIIGINSREDYSIFTKDGNLIAECHHESIL